MPSSVKDNTDKIDVKRLFNPRYPVPKYVLIKALIKKEKAIVLPCLKFQILYFFLHFFLHLLSFTFPTPKYYSFRYKPFLSTNSS